jgi:DNA-binding transcriptional LysR family regulator
LYAQPEYLARHGHPTHPRALATHAWIDLLGESAGGIELRHPQEGCCPITPPTSCLKVDRYFLQTDAIVDGRGLGLMPRWMVEAYLQAHPGTLEPCLPEWRGPDLEVQLLYSHGRLPRRMQTFIGFVRQSVPRAWR